jgi:hypothetical protein
MIDKKYIELMNREIDSANSPNESAELRDYLARNSEACRYYDELCSMANLISQAEMLEVPDGLKDDILSSLKPAAEGDRKRSRSPFLDLFRLNLRPKYAYVFAVGLVAGICLYALFERVSSNDNHLNINELYGTIAFDKTLPRPMNSVPLAIEVPGVRGSAQLQYFDNAIVAKLEVLSDADVDVVFSYPDEISFVLFKSLVGTDHDIHAENNKLTLTHSGISDYLLVFEKEADSRASLRLGVFSNGELLYEKTVNQGGSER